MGARVTSVTPVATSNVQRARVGVVVIAPAVSSAVEQLAATASFDAPVAALTAVVPATAIAYIDLSLQAVLDTSGRYRFVPDLAAVTDSFRFTLARPVSDSIFTADRPSFNIARPVSDSVTLSESFFKTLTFIRAYADSASLSEALAFNTAKLSTDIAIALDRKYLQLDRPVVDSVPNADALSILTAKLLVDELALGDASALYVGKAVTDAAAADDVLTFALSKLLADTSAPQDILTLGLAKLITDGFAMNDAFDTGDGSVFSFAKGVSNVTIASDASTRVVAKATADSTAVADAGSLLNQSYVEIGYFLEDYVGASRAF